MPSLASPQQRAEAQTPDDQASVAGVLQAVTVTGSFLTTEGTPSYTATLTNSTTGMAQELKDSTQSVSIITNRRMQDQPELGRIIDVIGNATGLSLQQSETNRFSISSRGMNVSSVSYDGVTTYYDTRFNFGDNLMDTALYDRVEVVRGATGFMTGPGNPSASINLVRKRASYRGPGVQGSAALGLGSWQLRRGQLDASTALTADGSVRARLVGAAQHRNGFLHRHGEQRHVLFGTLEADLGAATQLRLGADWQRNRSHGVMSGGLPLFYSDGSLTHFDRATNIAPRWAEDHNHNRSAYVVASHQFASGWKAETSYTHASAKRDFDNTYAFGSPAPLTHTGLQTSAMNRILGSRVQSSWDGKLNGHFDAWGRTHFVRLNASFNRNRYHNAYHAPLPGQLPRTWGDFTQPGFDLPAPQYQSESFTTQRGTRTQYALSGITELSVTDALALTLGLRLSRYQVRDDSFGPYFKPHNQRLSQPSRYLALSYKLTPEHSLYASYTDIFQPQTAMDASGAYLEPVMGRNYEVGFKSGLYGGQLNTAIALFEIRRDNVAIATGDTGPGGQAIYRPVDGARTRGLDAEISGAITPRWNVQAGLTTFVAHDAQGQRISRESANRSFKLFTTYTFAGRALHNLTIGGGLNWYGPTLRSVRNPARQSVDIRQPSRAIASLMLQYRLHPQAMLSLHVNNLFDQRYYTSYGAFTQYQWGAPRNVQLGFNYSF